MATEGWIPILDILSNCSTNIIFGQTSHILFGISVIIKWWTFQNLRRSCIFVQYAHKPQWLYSLFLEFLKFCIDFTKLQFKKKKICIDFEEELKTLVGLHQ